MPEEKGVFMVVDLQYDLKLDGGSPPLIWGKNNNSNLYDYNTAKLGTQFMRYAWP